MKQHAAWLLTAMTVAHAGEILDTEVIHEEGRYTVRFEVLLDAPADRIKQHLMDYESYTEHFRSVKESRILGRTPEGAVRLRLQLYSCVLFFCRTVTQVKDITEKPDGTLEARIEPELSDFNEGTETWSITPEDGQTRLRYRAQWVPNFYVPPLFGPWIVKGQIRNALESGTERLEAVSRE